MNINIKKNSSDSQGIPLSVFALPVILLIAFGLRISGISHGIAYHPDERHMIMVTEKLSWDDMNPHFFAYGSLPFYLLWFSAKGLALIDESFFSYDELFMVGRAICLIFALIAIIFTYKICQSCYGDRLISIIAATFLAFNPLHIQLSRFYTVDVILTTLLLVVIWASIRYYQTNKLCYLVLVSIFIGMALATKISALFIGLVVLAALIGGHLKAKKPIKIKALALLSAKAFLSLLIIFITFFICEPYAFLDFETFLKNSQEQTSMVRGLWRPPYTIQYEHTLPYLYHLKQIFNYTMGWPVALLAFGTLIIAAFKQFWRFKFEEIMILLWVLPFFFITAAFQVKYPRYLLPIYPSLFIFAAAPLAWLSLSSKLSLSALSLEESYREVIAASDANKKLHKFSWKKIAPYFLGAAFFFLVLFIAFRLYPLFIKASDTASANETNKPQAAKSYLSNTNMTIGGLGLGLGRFNNVMGLAIFNRQFLYAADMGNHRIQKFSMAGVPILSFGKKGSLPGQFNEPRDLAVDEKGFLYVVDSWNHRIQKFSPEGRFVKKWSAPQSLYGPRGIAYHDGRVYVTDSGHHRVVIFNSDGRFLNEFGSLGTKSGEFKEPVGIAVDGSGRIYVVDSANNRVQAFSPEGDFIKLWKIPGWQGDSIKESYITLNGVGSLLLSDPVAHKIYQVDLEQGMGITAPELLNPEPFNGISGIAFIEENVFIAERGLHRIRKLP